jgi:hypothetical protein
MLHAMNNDNNMFCLIFHDRLLPSSFPTACRNVDFASYPSNLEVETGNLRHRRTGCRQTDEFCSFSLICLAVERCSEPVTADRTVLTDRRILFFFTYLSGRRAPPFRCIRMNVAGRASSSSHIASATNHGVRPTRQGRRCRDKANYILCCLCWHYLNYNPTHHHHVSQPW